VPSPDSIMDMNLSEIGSPECEVWLHKCQSLAGQLRFLCDFTRPDIGASLSYASRYVHRASEDVYKHLLYILAHCVATKNWKLWYGPGQDRVIREHVVEASDLKTDPWKPFDAFMLSDASHGVKPLLCVLFFCGGGLIDWGICRAGSTTLSICEGEWYAMCMAATKAVVFRPIFEFLSGCEIRFPLILFVDSKSAIQLSEKDLTSKAMKHVHVRLAYLQEAVNERMVIQPVKILGERNLADIGTKIFPPQTFHMLREPYLHA